MKTLLITIAALIGFTVVPSAIADSTPDVTSDVYVEEFVTEDAEPEQEHTENAPTEVEVTEPLEEWPEDYREEIGTSDPDLDITAVDSEDFTRLYLSVTGASLSDLVVTSGNKTYEPTVEGSRLIVDLPLNQDWNVERK